MNSITLTATVTRTAGSDVDTGTATLEALGGSESRVDLSLTSGPQTEIIGQSQGGPAGQWSDTNLAVHPMALHNCLTPASWFFPTLVVEKALNDPTVTAVYIAQEALNGQEVQHIRFSQAFPIGNTKGTMLADLERLSAADIYLDAAGGLPVALDYEVHPDNNSAVNIPIEIRYDNFQKINGILMPAHIQKLINNSPLLDMSVTNVAIDTNLSPADFAVAPQGQ